VHVKDLLPLVSYREAGSGESVPAPVSSQGALPDFDLRRFLRELLIVPEGKSAGELLIEMRARRISLAMVVDEFGSILGLVTLEDVLEQMVGEIHDEFDVVQAPQIVGSGPEMAIVFDGAVSLRDLETQYEISLPEDPAYVTLGGFVLAKLGFIPRGGESFDFGGYRFTVLEMERHRVARIKLQRLMPTAPAARVERQSPQPKSSALPQP
jgi:CBS domain containing-hemolysin-like protein